MKKMAGYLLVLIFLNGFAVQICKSYFNDYTTIENMSESEEKAKKSLEDLNDLLKEKITTPQYIKLNNFGIALKQFTDLIFQFKNPSLQVVIIPPETIS